MALDAYIDRTEQGQYRLTNHYRSSIYTFNSFLKNTMFDFSNLIYNSGSMRNLNDGKNLQQQTNTCQNDISL
ncbi:hypothetical protein AtNW77_Chr3g0173721 [Arabidopsis thaliana]|uniref:Uncharacterized protein n=3 Tax=Arabidopsis TaxID=3701 RepID=A0A654FHB5_ARATH|nr:uncharacterized protein AT3G16712 [Arabidopsis thaliana]AEE75856.1 hypothetical protein AT3G16712 [Arabidopsis thaliana]KAG7625498.1 hypothetical protein ISN45_At03g017290 [Arabidopsis thaliana x Arabidopsis arenosa]VYS57611.1 unnamed protein product [Arabidopsis thaliana]|eukprot:NP_001118646.1 hypothetical protein AT3G16712 [Arabidopsis thaliana]